MPESNRPEDYRLELLHRVASGPPDPRVAPLVARPLVAPEPKRKVLRPIDLKRLSSFEFATKLVVEGYFHGKHRSPFSDFSSEFSDYRQYTPGDDIRRLDWRALARTDRYYVKLYRKETDLHCYVLLDNSASMSYSGITRGAVSKLDYGTYLAAALSYLIIKQHDRAGLTLTEDPGGRYIPPSGTHQGLQKIVGTLERVQASGTANLARSIETLFGLTKQRRGLVVVISDFLDDLDPIFCALGMFTHRGFAVLLVQVLTDEELMLPGDMGSAIYLDLESPATVTAEPDVIRRAYQEEMTAFLADVRNRAKARRIHHELGVTSKPYDRVLEAFLTARA